MIENGAGVALRCTNRPYGRLCGYAWVYRGSKQPGQTTNCPRCHRSVTIPAEAKEQ